MPTAAAIAKTILISNPSFFGVKVEAGGIVALLFDPTTRWATVDVGRIGGAFDSKPGGKELSAPWVLKPDFSLKLFEPN